MPLNDQALQWAKSNSNDPRAKAILARSWAEQNPNDPRSAQISERYSAQSKQNPTQITRNTLTPDDFTKSGESIPKEAGLGNFLKYNVAHFDPNSPTTLMGAAGGSMGDIAASAPGNLAKGANSLAEAGANRSEVLGKVKNVEELEPYVQGKINEARQSFNQNEIAPRMTMQKSMVGGHTVKVDPKQLEGISPEVDGIAKTLSPGADGLAELPGTEALKLRENLNKGAGWKAHPMDAGRAQAVNSQVAALHQDISKQFAGINPDMASTSQELQEAYNIQKNSLGHAGRNPINTVLTSNAVTGLGKEGRLRTFDKAAGSDLEGLGDNIKLAHKRMQHNISLGDLVSWGGPKKFINEGVSAAGRAYDYLGSTVQPGTEALSSFLNNPNVKQTIKPLTGLLQGSED